MKKKKRNHGRVLLRARRAPRASRTFSARRRAGSRKQKAKWATVEWKPVEWLRMLPARIEDDVKALVAKRLFADRNGARPRRNLELSITEAE
jgi:hypothetical protein